MCGIIGAVAERDVVPILLEGLKRLEYRGYDSVGVAIIDQALQGLRRERVAGKVRQLEQVLKQHSMYSPIGIAHTRWSTHGKPSEVNAHPHFAKDKVAVVHNGIIENHQILRQALQQKGHIFQSETDTEVIAHLIHDNWLEMGDLTAAIHHSLKMLQGSYSVAILSPLIPGTLFAARRGSPLVIGVGVGEHFIASDVAALVSVTQQVIFLEEGDIAHIQRDSFIIYDFRGQKVERELHLSHVQADAVERGHFRHYMQKEIFEQAHALRETLAGRVYNGRVLEGIFGASEARLFAEIYAVQIIACGTSYHAGLIASHWIETLAKLPCSVEVASEFRYRQPLANPNALVVAISQSGETADTLAALQEAKRLGFGPSLAICNVPESSLVRTADMCFMTRAGIEIGVASTKAFTTQLLALLLLTVVLGKHNGTISESDMEGDIVHSLEQLPHAVDMLLRKVQQPIKNLAERFADKYHALFLGRGIHYPVAKEGALKLKEISYIHAEAYPAGELKHGPLALVDANMPVIAVAPNDALQEKLKSNLEEVHARGGQLFIFANHRAIMQASDYITVVELGEIDELISPILYTIPLQLLAYHVALIKGTDVDQPRNLAKSVTVE
ncbi:glutamine--fructose-6-phosphate transaminase (isomerizing) [Thioflexithrix psekupsensis]|uniref:Glutamine--fructose-6-phosphate aminotransferase [isomerizing] n=1 Tax=Thioflexithrix psekupsensis TaxID=1570016 RepID=A0A251X4F6_9GAMM|nr:glutamine--fructose-6-phosphate transaminase (isomerizing) [Thioflexithrix psekupsensis]OUD12276.1 glutamine--fructose-6-phosphate transaminase (isomerizing) [Thioflexithrix psekupsensis]